jgi:hypothetical protein
MLAPQLVEEAVGGKDLVRVQQQERQKRTLTRPPKRERPPLVENFERPENPVLQRRLRGRT